MGFGRLVEAIQSRPYQNPLRVWFPAGTYGFIRTYILMDARDLVIGGVPIGNHLAVCAKRFIRLGSRRVTVLKENRNKFAALELFPIAAIVE